jgi:predicted TIM-barrel fold metal-dependent hydrolase
MNAIAGSLQSKFLASSTAPLATTVVDVDSHFEPGDDWLQPYPELAARLPKLNAGILAINTIAGDLLRDVPKEKWPPIAELMPPGLATLFAQEKAQEKERRAEFEGKHQFQVANAQARLKWMDEQGIHIQNVICLSGIAYSQQVEDEGLRREAIATANTWLADTCATSNGRLLPVTALDFSDLDWVVAELQRMRKRGSRIFLIPGYPVNGVPPIHPEWDKIWDTATALGMMPMLHTGFEHMSFDPGWANNGGDVTLLRMLGGSVRHVAPTTLVNGMVYSGVFERFPTLTLILAEVGVGWLPFMYREIDDRASPVAELFLGKWKYPLRPHEYLARNVKGTPLNGGNDQPLQRIIDDLPEGMLVFSTDTPHFEGISDPATHYAAVLAGSSPQQRANFLGGSICEAFARMNHPLLIPS